MPTYEIRNRRSRMVIGEVTVDEPEHVLNEWMAESGMTLEDVFRACGGSMEGVRATLAFVEIQPRGPEVIRRTATTPLRKAMPARLKRLYREEVS